MVFNIFEILDVVLMTLIIGFLFHDVFRKPQREEDILDQYKKRQSGPFGIDWRDFWWASAIIAPSILVHELGHKFTALAFGLDATFHAACSTANMFPGTAPFLNFYCLLTIATVAMKAMGLGFLIFVPAFVTTSGNGTMLEHLLVSAAGPLVHLVFWLGAAYLLKNKQWLKKIPVKKQIYLFFFKQINMFLFILNMLPIPGFDGYKVFYFLIEIVKKWILQ